MRARAGAMALLTYLLASSLSAQAAPAPAGASMAILDDDPSRILGLGLGEVLALLGSPSSAMAVRGAEAWQDDVALIYPAGYAAFIYGDRVWQLRFTKPYAGSIFGLFMDDASDKALSVLGQPYESGDGFLEYRMPYKSYPVRLRLALKDDRIADAYLYRADF